MQLSLFMTMLKAPTDRYVQQHNDSVAELTQVLTGGSQTRHLAAQCSCRGWCCLFQLCWCLARPSTEGKGTVRCDSVVGVPVCGRTPWHGGSSSHKAWTPHTQRWHGIAWHKCPHYLHAPTQPTLRHTMHSRPMRSTRHAFPNLD